MPETVEVTVANAAPLSLGWALVDGKTELETGAVAVASSVVLTVRRSDGGTEPETVEVPSAVPLTL